MRSRNQRSWLTITDSREILQRLFQRPQRIDVEVIGRFVEQQQVGARASILARCTRLRSPPESVPTFFCWSAPLKLNEAQ